MNASRVGLVYRFAGTTAVLVLSVCLTACGDASSSPNVEATVVVTKTATATPRAQSDDQTDSAEDGVGEADGGETGASFRMPNEVGKALQAAQDDLQARSGDPFFYSDSMDATSADRLQVLDSGWKVCSQNKRPGARVSVTDQSIVFRVVRLGERCP